MALDAVIFDWGGTLSEEASVDLADMWRAAARHLCPDREDEVCARLAAVELAAWEDTRIDERSFRLSELLAAATDELGLDVSGAVLEEAATSHLDSWTPHIHHDPDAAPVLRELRDRGLRIALLSNTHWPRTFHEHFLERDGLVDLIDVRLYTSDMDRRKPHPDVFEAAMAAAGATDPTRVVVVGDRPYDDVHGAVRAGMRSVLRRGRGVPAFDVTPDAVIDRLPELVPIVDGWMASRRSGPIGGTPPSHP